MLKIPPTSGRISKSADTPLGWRQQFIRHPPAVPRRAASPFPLDGGQTLGGVGENFLLQIWSLGEQPNYSSELKVNFASIPNKMAVNYFVHHSVHDCADSHVVLSLPDSRAVYERRRIKFVTGRPYQAAVTRWQGLLQVRKLGGCHT